MNEKSFEDYASIDIYNVCLSYVTGGHDNAGRYRAGIRELQRRGEYEHIYSIALNVTR